MNVKQGTALLLQLLNTAAQIGSTIQNAEREGRDEFHPQEYDSLVRHAAGAAGSVAQAIDIKPHPALQADLIPPRNAQILAAQLGDAIKKDVESGKPSGLTAETFGPSVKAWLTALAREAEPTA